MKRSCLLLFALLTTALGAPGSALPAVQDPERAEAQGPAQGETTPAAIQARIDEVKQDKALSEELRTAIQEALGRALELARDAEAQEAQASRLAGERRAAPDELKAKRDQLANYPQPVPPEPPPADVTTRDIEQSVARAQTELADAAKEVADLEKEAIRRTERRTQIPTRLAEVQKALDALPTQAAEEGVDPRLGAARRIRLESERRRLTQEKAALEAELALYEAREELLTVRRDLAARRSANAKVVAEAWQAIQQERRAQEAAEAQRRAEQAAAEADHPLLKQLAQDNAEIAQHLPELAASLKHLEERLSRAESTRNRLRLQFEDIKKRAQRGGSSQSIGTLLRQLRAQLPDRAPAPDRQVTRRDVQEVSAAQAYLDSLDWEERRRELVDDVGLLDRLLANTAPLIDEGPELEKLRQRAQQLLDNRQEMLQTLSTGWSQYLRKLDDLEAVRSEIQGLADEVRTFINERVLWIRSSAPVWQLDLEQAARALAWATRPGSWWNAYASLWHGFTTEAWPFALLGLVVLLLLLRPLLLGRLRAHGAAAARGNNTRYLPTTLALLDTVLLAAPVPALLWLLGWRLLESPDCSTFDRAMAAGAAHSAVFLAIIRTLREIVRVGGLAEVHFQWQNQTLRLFRRHLILLVPAAFPLALLLGALELLGDDAWLGSLGRMALLPLLALLTVFLWLMLHPQSGVLSSGGSARTWLGRFRRLWFLLAVGTPVSLMVMTLLGYDYTALQLARRLQYTVALVLAGALVHALIMRGLLLERRRLIIEQSRARLQAAKAARAKAQTGKDADADDDEEELEIQLDPASVAKQTQTLLRAAVFLVVLFASWQIWVDVLPALGVFRHVTIWEDTSVDPSINITLADLLTSLVILGITTIAARNLPGLLELAVLQRLRIQAGERNAITTLARYVLVTVGIVIAFSTVGLGWSKVQWLVAALSLGLGFGLQEIFANFVSGLILLFERPVRVGDIVVVGDLLGKVTRIRIRATTVRDLDNKELVVPNKEFVTGRFVNWTLTDSLVRLRVPVGVAYGSDTEKARRLLVQAAKDSPLAARSPQPKALFLGFGDSTLNLELRLFVEDYDQHADLLDDVHTRIDKLFRQHDVEIAFPQRDLHLRSARPLLDFMLRRDAEREEAASGP